MVAKLVRLTLVVLVAAAFAACGAKSSSPEEQLLGTWTLDPEMFKETKEYKDASDAERKMMMGLLQGMNMEVTFTEDKVKMSMKAEFMGQKQESAEEGSYRVVATEGNTLTLEATDKSGKTERIEAEVDGDRLIFRDEEGKTFTLRRK